MSSSFASDSASASSPIPIKAEYAVTGFQHDQYNPALFGSSRDAEIACTKCAKIPKDGVATECGHIFCNGCILTGQKCTAKNCGNSVTSIIPDYRLRNKIKDLTVLCPHSKVVSSSSSTASIETKGDSKRGGGSSSDTMATECDWTGAHKDLSPHLLDSCKFTRVVCRMCTTSWEGTRQQYLEEHRVKTCPSRMVQCAQCGENIKFDKHEEHVQRVCPKGEVACRHCETKVARSQATDHETKCPRRIVDCKYKYLGCNEQVRASDYEAHVADSARHFGLLAEAYVRMSTQVAAMESQVGEVVGQLRQPEAKRQILAAQSGKPLIRTKEADGYASKVLQLSDETRAKWSSLIMADEKEVAMRNVLARMFSSHYNNEKYLKQQIDWAGSGDASIIEPDFTGHIIGIVDAKDKSNNWYVAYVIDGIDQNSTNYQDYRHRMSIRWDGGYHWRSEHVVSVKVHFVGFKDNYDELIANNGLKLAPLHTYTRGKPMAQ